MELMHPSEEERLVRIAEEAATAISEGAAPDDAIYKVAEDNQLSPTHVRRLCQAINLSRSVSVLKKAADRTVEHPLADPAAVIRRLYGEQKKVAAEMVASSVETYRQRPPMEKAAFGPVSLLGDASTPALPRLTGSLSSLGMEAETLLKHHREKRAAAQAAFERDLDELAEWSAQNSQKFAECEARAVRMDRRAAPLLDLVYERTGLGETHRLCSGGQPLASRGSTVKLSSTVIVDRQTAPYNLIAKAIDSLTAFRDAAQEYQQMEEKAAAFKAKAIRSEISLRRSLARDEFLRSGCEDAYVFNEKTAESFMQIRAQAMPWAQFGWRSLRGRTPDELEDHAAAPSDPNAPNLLEDPDIDAEMKGARATAALHDLMTNDEVLSESDPQMVIDAYNDIVSTAPDLADRPGVLRGALRKAVHQGGALEPFEMRELAGMPDATKGRQLQPS